MGTLQEVMRLQDPKVQVNLMAEKFPGCDISGVSSGI